MTEEDTKVNAHKNFPLAEVKALGPVLVKSGKNFFQVFTCEKCKQRVKSNALNLIADNPRCVDCDELTSVTESGCNLVAA